MKETLLPFTALGDDRGALVCLDGEDRRYVCCSMDGGVGLWTVADNQRLIVKCARCCASGFLGCAETMGVSRYSFVPLRLHMGPCETTLGPLRSRLASRRRGIFDSQR
jgi:hypothetical protein